YRQKSMLSNLENIGWTQKGAACMFNIDSMEECCSILACGAGAISKRIFNLENRIERSQNVRFLKDYIERIDEMIERKKVLFV
ncbi:MAG: coproporphyrinogen dehydrogenase HemZ, partial [Clostridia bacterium]